MSRALVRGQAAHFVVSACSRVKAIHFMPAGCLSAAKFTAAVSMYLYSLRSLQSLTCWLSSFVNGAVPRRASFISRCPVQMVSEYPFTIANAFTAGCSAAGCAQSHQLTGGTHARAKDAHYIDAESVVETRDDRCIGDNVVYCSVPDAGVP